MTTDLAGRIAGLPKMPSRPEYDAHWLRQGYSAHIASGLARDDWNTDAREALRARNDLLVEALETAIEDLESHSVLLPKGKALFCDVLAACKVSP